MNRLGFQSRWRSWINLVSKKDSDTSADESERGAALVEFAMVLLLLTGLTSGIYEIGTAWRSSQTVTQASRDGARVGSQIGVPGETDAEILRAVEASLGSEIDNVVRVVVYEADAQGNMPSACASAPVFYSGGANCNVYGPNHFTLLGPGSASEWGSGSSCGVQDRNWCSATERSSGPIVADLTYLGVLVEIDKPSVTQLFGTGPLKISQKTVMRLEPREVSP